MSARIEKFRSSPLRRHPRLLARKVLQRLGWRRDAFSFRQPPPGIQLADQTTLAAILRAWIAQAKLDPTPYPWTRLFRQEFDEGFLLERCVHGPIKEKSLRGDIKLIWEFGRLQGLFLAAAQGSASAEDIARKLSRWLDANRNPDGPAWINAMEVGLRAVNLIATDALLDGGLHRAFGESQWIHLLWNHAQAIDARLEAKLVSSNHYLANLLGLFAVSRHLAGHPDLDAWRDFSGNEFPAALAAQTLNDGGAYEASLPYHALITEMALLYLAFGGRRDKPFMALAGRMTQINTDMRESTGDVICFGDDDGGRVLPLDFATTGLGRVDHLSRLAQSLGIPSSAPSPIALYPDSGWACLRHGPWMLAVEFGGVGFRGQGAHAHNDTISFVLSRNNRRLFTDPGSYLYSPDPDARNRYRSTAMHNTIRIDGWEHLDIPAGTAGSLFSLPGPAGPASSTLANEHSLALTFTIPGQSIALERTFDFRDGRLVVSDRIEGRGRHCIEWFFHLAPKLEVILEGAALAIMDGVERLATMTAPTGVVLEVIDDEVAPFYGSRTTSRVVRASMETELPFEGSWPIG